MVFMIEVEVLIPNFKDKENFSKEITIIRNGKELKVINTLLQPGDRYKITKERADYLIEKNIVKIYKEPKKKESPEKID